MQYGWANKSDGLAGVYGSSFRKSYGLDDDDDDEDAKWLLNWQKDQEEIITRVLSALTNDNDLCISIKK